MNADELRAMGLYHTADWGQTANTRAGSAGKVRAFSGSPFELLDAADAMHDELLARIAELEAEAARLRCCGNCGHRDEETLDYYGSYFVCLTEFKPKTNMRHMEVDCEDPCRFTPSRWKEAER